MRISDWSSDVCSSDLDLAVARGEHDRRVEHDRGRVVAALERGRVQERLEARPRLAPRLGGAVELAAGEAEATGERQQRPVLRVQRYQGGLRARQLVELPGHLDLGFFGSRFAAGSVAAGSVAAAL